MTFKTMRICDYCDNPIGPYERYIDASKYADTFFHWECWSESMRPSDLVTICGIEGISLHAKEELSEKVERSVEPGQPVDEAERRKQAATIVSLDEHMRNVLEKEESRNE